MLHRHLFFPPALGIPAAGKLIEEKTDNSTDTVLTAFHAWALQSQTRGREGKVSERDGVL